MNRGYATLTERCFVNHATAIRSNWATTHIARHRTQAALGNPAFLRLLRTTPVTSAGHNSHCLPFGYLIWFAHRRLRKPICAGTATARRLRFSSTVVRGFEIARFVAKRDPVASDFDRNPSLRGGGIRNCLCPIRIDRAGALEMAQTDGRVAGLKFRIGWCCLNCFWLAVVRCLFCG